MNTYQGSAWSALGDPTRRAIFERIVDHPQAVVELARGLPVSRPAVSQHLKVLKEARLIMDRRVQNRRVYELNPEGLSELREQLDGFWRKALSAYQEAVELSTEEDK
ncbi:MAG TPA: metalloregulator ArsR/SmtB family transcription factor [Dehalococcoidia bacterium]|nr:metalloregulator ArsR/SmtB family transcription factor [Dehalococcoidia bacterium]